MNKLFERAFGVHSITAKPLSTVTKVSAQAQTESHFEVEGAKKWLAREWRGPESRTDTILLRFSEAVRLGQKTTWQKEMSDNPESKDDGECNETHARSWVEKDRTCCAPPRWFTDNLL